MRTLERLDQWLNAALAWAAGLALMAMMLFTVADMVLRGLGRPVAGSYEIIGWLSAAAMALALGYTQRHRGHVAIDLLTTRLAGRTRTAIELVMTLLALLLFAAVAWYLARYGRVLHETGSLSETLKAIVYPWVYVVAAGAAGLTLALLVELLKSATRLRTMLRQHR
ncbi:MAG: TRAP transporter small permease [Burkholderiaceae bacterium]|nr:TRAP transporter small permease [Burkholderiaceae bacterium]